jgi:hypothetical protein
MRCATVNFILDLVGFLVLLGLAGTGIIIALPHEHGPNEAKLLGIGRGEWGDIHLWLGITFAVLMLVHLILHWDWVKCYVKSLFDLTEKSPTCEKDTPSTPSTLLGTGPLKAGRPLFPFD